MGDRFGPDDDVEQASLPKPREEEPMWLVLVVDHRLQILEWPRG